MASIRARVVVGMSGGVDSSVAAWLLREEGFEVIGMTMKVWSTACMTQAEDACCGPSAVADARAVAHTLGIAHYVIDEAGDFDRLVVEDFVAQYQRGRTPNPCIVCNERVKFGTLWESARAVGADFLATGHYARVAHGSGGSLLYRGADLRKDQSYFLYRLSGEQLGRTLLPLGGVDKAHIRALARQIGLRVADKADSQEICFVPGNDYKDFLRNRLGAGAFHAGGIYDTGGRLLSKHEGVEFFTIGQRKGLPGGSPHALYVVDIDAEKGAVIVGGAEELLREGCTVEHCNWIGEPPHADFDALVKIRYAHAGVEATVHPRDDGTAHIAFHTPQRAVTPGQAAVCYQGERVLGGGIIKRGE